MSSPGFDEIYAKYHKLVYWAAYSVAHEQAAAMDISQEVFLKAWNNLSRLAGMEEDVRAMPMGLRTLVPERAGFSGGQKQRLLIARAVAGKPKVLLLDEATSALENLTQKQVSDALSALSCTRIVAAHRLSTIAQCDRVLVLERGRIVEDGGYDELIDKNGAFAKLVRRQRL